MVGPPQASRIPVPSPQSPVPSLNPPSGPPPNPLPMPAMATNPAPAARPASAAEPAAPVPMPLALLVLSLFYGGMVCIAGVLGAKQVALGPLAVEAGIFGFILLVVMASTIAELYGRATADRVVRLGFVPLIVSMALIQLVLALPTDEGMWEPAKAAFPIVLG